MLEATRLDRDARLWYARRRRPATAARELPRAMHHALGGPSMTRFEAIAATVALAVALAIQPGFARVSVKVEYDKVFDFAAVRTWGWNPHGPGEVKMARTQEDDPEAMRARAEPVILDAVAAAMTRRGLRQAAAGADLNVTYYLLLSTTMTAQTLGQFLPAVTDWGLPPFAPATQSLEVLDHGSLVLDLSDKGAVVWRGVAQAKIKIDAAANRRESLLREAVRDILAKYPPRR